MQVSQQADHITHAVIGNQESISMGMSSDAALMHIFSSTLYTYPALAAIREPICNAWDAHINAGKTDLPLEIKLTDSLLSIRDFGAGIPHDKIGSIYGVYGNSTKRDDSTVTGGFGLGSKAPFAYTDNFEVVSCCDGVKTVYRVSKSSMELGGKPSINKIVSIPTTETGITVSMTVKPHDIPKFRQMVEEVLMLGQIKASINGLPPIQTIPLEESPTGYIINSFVGTIHSQINLRYGNVVYPIPMHEAYKDQWVVISKAIRNLWNNANIIFMAPPDSVSIAPNREALILTDNTVKTVTEMLKMFDAREIDRSSDSVRQVIRAQVNKSIAAESKESTFDRLIRVQGIDTGAVKFGHEHPTGPFAYTVRRASMAHRITQSGRIVANDELTVKRLKKMIVDKTIDKKFGTELLAAYYKMQQRQYRSSYNMQTPITAVIHRNITAPLYAKIAADPKLNRDRLYQVNGRYWHSAEMISFKKICATTLLEGIRFGKKRALICRSKNDGMAWLQRNHNNENRNGWVVYQVTTSLETQIKAIEMFESLGYEVFEHLPEKIKEVSTLPDGSVVEVPTAKKPPAKKRVGYMTLNHSYHKSSTYNKTTFLLTTAREKFKEEEAVTDPIAFAVLRSKAEGAERIGVFGIEESQMINKLFGDKIAVVTSVQADILLKKGVPSVNSYVLQHVDAQLSAAKDFGRYLAFSAHLEESYKSELKVIRNMVRHKDLMESLGLRFHISAETEMLLTFYKNRRNRFGETEGLPLCSAMQKKVPESPALKKVVAKLKSSTWFDFINMTYLSEILENDKQDSPQAIAACEIVQKLLK